MEYLLLKYYKPKNFEFFRRDSIYSLIGIRTFKKFVPTTGDLARRNKKKLIKINSKNQINELYKYELKTRTLELRHLIGMAIFIFFIFVLKKEYELFDYVFVSVLFLTVNIYPILLQRHNRIRVLNVLKRFGKESPYETL
jgi:hypothetical protein